MSSNPDSTLTALDYHVLLAIAENPMHGYAIRDAVEHESEGTLAPRAGTLYRVIARLMSSGWVAETEAPADTGPHPGRARRYYRLTPEGRATLSDEARRLRGAVALAEERLSTGRP